MFDRPDALWLLILAPLVGAGALASMRRGEWLLGAIVCTLRLLAFAIIVAALAGLRIPSRGAARHNAVIVALDQSSSIAADQFAWMRSRAAELGRAMDPGDQLGVIGFGRDIRLLARLDDPRMLSIRGSAGAGATDIAAAMTAAAGLFPAEDEKKLVILSDGNENQGDAAAELPSMAEQQVSIFTALPPPSSIERVALANFDAPRAVRAHASFGLRVDVDSEARRPLAAHLKLRADGKLAGDRSVLLQPGFNRFELAYRIDEPGASLLGAQLEVAPPTEVINAAAEAAISVAPRARILVVSSDRPDSMLSALRIRDYRVEQATPRSLSSRADDYLKYQAVILADVTADALWPPAQQALARYVAAYGGGLIVTGDALRDDRFRQSALEKVLPIAFRPQPPPPEREPLAVYLCIDRSNSMSYNSRYPAVRDSERIRYAKQAAIALLRQLDDTDYAGVIAFDSQPYVLARLSPLGRVREDLENRVARLQPGGGTDFKESLEIAKREILESRLAVRQVILITDGDTNRQYHDHDALIAEFADERIPVSTIRIGPDLANLRLLEDFAQATGGLFYRVEDIEKLPQLLVRLTRKAMNPSAQSQIRVRYQKQSAILSGISAGDIPPVEYFTTTEAKDGARVPLMIEQGQTRAPLVAAWQYGLGRSAVLALDTDSLSALNWIKWDRYAEFWSQLVTWTMREGSGAFDLQIKSSSREGLVIVAQKGDKVPAGTLVCRIAGQHRTFDVAMTQEGDSLYRGDSSTLARGKYTATLMRKEHDTEQVLATRQFAVADLPRADAAELSLHPPNRELLSRLASMTGGRMNAKPADILRHTGAVVTVYRSADWWLLPFAIAMILAEVLVRRRYTSL